MSSIINPNQKGAKGDPGTAASVSVGTTTTGAPGSSASVTNSGTSSAAIFNFTVPRGNAGLAGSAATVAVGTVTTGAPGSSASVSNAGTSGAAILNFTIPRGDSGANGAAATIAVGTVTTGAAGTSASISNAGTSAAAIFNFTIPRGDVGAQGPAGLGTVTPSTPSRTLGTSFQPNATKATLVTYTVRTQVTNPLLIGTSRAEVKLFSDASATPTTERCRVAAESGVGITVTIALTTANEAVLTYLVPAGHYVRMVSTVTGTGAASIVAQCEETLG